MDGQGGDARVAHAIKRYQDALRLARVAEGMFVAKLSTCPDCWNEVLASRKKVY